MTRACALVLLAVLSFARPAAADPDAARQAIAAQLEAFRARDAEAAYSYAAPAIKRMYPTAEHFIAMVQGGYRPVYEARDTVFLRARQPDRSTFVQEVGLVDARGQPWVALYTLARQADGTWRITGCYLRKRSGRSI